MGLEKLAELKKHLAKNSTDFQSNTAVNGKKTKKNAPVDPVVLIIGRLQKAFPVAFPKSPSPKVPLKVGILDDLNSRSEELGISPENLQLALKTWCKSPRYWSAVKPGATRYDLDGNSAGTVESNGAAQAQAMAKKHTKAKQTNF
jgi:ProP effector